MIDLYSKVPLGGRTVMVGHRSTVTAADGSFEITAAPDVYDIGVLDSDRSNLSIYRGLSLRDDLVLAHPVAEPIEHRPHFSRLQGNLSGGAKYPLSAWNDIVAVYFFSDRLIDRLFIGGGAGRRGPQYAMGLGFNGEERLEGTLFALGTFAPDPARHGKYPAAVAKKNVVITAGVTESVDLHLEPVDLGVVRASVVAPDALSGLGVYPYYRFPFRGALGTFGALVPIPNADVLRGSPTEGRREFTFDVPKLVEAGATLCLRATVEAHPRRQTEVCGIELDGEPMVVELDASPVLAKPVSGETVNGAFEYVWTKPANAISMLELTPDSEPSSEQPTIRVFTVESSAVIDSARWSLPPRTGWR
ncbi:MAG TPA: hypothetical protein VER33_14250 [Polyangiaceae bacterium]|nr:hypothetical protein [Polyangiaceae bacterium]